MPPEGDSAGSSSSTGGLSNLPWSQVPSFKRGETDLTEWSRKVEFLASLWPPEQLHLLAPRVALQCEGSAFQRVARLDPKKLRVGNLEGVKAIVEALEGFGENPDWRTSLKGLSVQSTAQSKEPTRPMRAI